MADITLLSKALTAYVHDHTTPEAPIFGELREETHADLSSPQMQVGRVEGAFLKLMVQVSGARRVLEIGTFSGYSAMAMASGLPEGGELITCDVDPEATAVARRYWDRSPWGDKITLRLGDAKQTVAALAEAGERFDMVFIDADKTSYQRYWDLVLPMLPVGGIVLADNTLWSGRVLAPEGESCRAIVAFNQQVREDPRVEQVLLSVRDGIMFARKLRD
ncbi:class I SAM-dependent methyltransferase [Pseudenhygromyxa sp. WMMC2535]|uniref:O-methyltransferase n=1 Tax=Pseudenhygromyxa sp. WMMC2535 TaxID=2712867 RepID=UPI0015540018|nr:class I SAM-dependent methyltransferase [Pseudenhygromyxa sp. WMMC2535]NVB43219.1 class I SAM-dependent methyltransferase [Pseudenhygromyxa sp. WMMC2535]